MLISVLTIFPELFETAFSKGMAYRSTLKGCIEYEIINIRDEGVGAHKKVDDTACGGGPGTVMLAEPLFQSIQKAIRPELDHEIIYLSPKGSVYNQELAEEFSTKEHLILLCGHYEGIDERIRQHYITREISLGDYILTGGEFAAMILVDSVIRLVPGVIGNPDSLIDESFNGHLLDYPQYSRPAEFNGYSVPKILLSGNHQAIADWRYAKAIEHTRELRPDLYQLYIEKNREKGHS